MMKISQNTTDRILLWAAFLLPVLTLILLRAFVLRNGAEYGVDTLYHVRMADMGPGVITGKQFPWLDVSVWRDTFADKEMLYHLFLWVLIRIQTWFGIPLNPPFHCLAAVPILLLSGSWIYAGKKSGLQASFIFLGSLLLTGIAATWTSRILMMRPHVISIAAMLICFGYLTSQASFLRKIIFTIVLSFVFSWTYSNPHFIAIPVFCYAVAGWKQDGWRVFLLPFIALAGTAAGLTLHPQFPNSWLVWKVQSLDAVYAPMMKIVQTTPIEMRPPVFAWIRRTIPFYVLVLFELFLLVRLTEKKGWKALTPAIGMSSLMAFAFTFASFTALRSIEYAVPFAVLLFILLLSEWKSLIPERSHVKIFCLICGAGVCCFVFCVWSLVRSPERKNRPVPAMYRWMQKNLAPREKIINLSWADFPPLFYSCPEQYYIWGMDPAFSVAVSPKKVNMICTMMLGQQRIPPEVLYYQFSSRYAVLLARNAALALRLQRSGWKIKAEIKDKNGQTEGWIFSLDPNESARLPILRITPQQGVRPEIGK